MTGEWPSRDESAEILRRFYRRGARLRRALLRWRWRLRDRRAERSSDERSDDFMEHGRDDAWPDEQVWDFDGVKLTEREFQAALQHYEETGERPDWATSD